LRDYDAQRFPNERLGPRIEAMSRRVVERDAFEDRPTIEIDQSDERSAALLAKNRFNREIRSVARHGGAGSAAPIRRKVDVMFTNWKERRKIDDPPHAPDD
jgi:hypothetical protein